jgi:hypothetical protein
MYLSALQWSGIWDLILFVNRAQSLLCLQIHHTINSITDDAEKLMYLSALQWSGIWDLILFVTRAKSLLCLQIHHTINHITNDAEKSVYLSALQWSGIWDFILFVNRAQSLLLHTKKNPMSQHKFPHQATPHITDNAEKSRLLAMATWCPESTFS